MSSPPMPGSCDARRQVPPFDGDCWSLAVAPSDDGRCPSSGGDMRISPGLEHLPRRVSSLAPKDDPMLQASTEVISAVPRCATAAAMDEGMVVAEHGGLLDALAVRSEGKLKQRINYALNNDGKALNSSSMVYYDMQTGIGVPGAIFSEAAIGHANDEFWLEQSSSNMHNLVSSHQTYFCMGVGDGLGTGCAPSTANCTRTPAVCRNATFGFDVQNPIFGSSSGFNNPWLSKAFAKPRICRNH